MNNIKKCKCGGELKYYDRYNFDIFPIGNILINKSCYICKDCNDLYCDELLSNKKYEIYNKKLNEILMNDYNFYKNPDLWMNINEFSKKIKFDIDYILNNSDFFMTGIYNIKINNEYYFLKKSVDLYLKEDNGLFWLIKDNHNIMHNSCSWCGIGDKHMRQYHNCYDKKIGNFKIFYPIETCTYCGSFCVDEKFDKIKEEIIKKHIQYNIKNQVYLSSNKKHQKNWKIKNDN